MILKKNLKKKIQQMVSILGIAAILVVAGGAGVIGYTMTTHRMCFVAGTLIVTKAGMKPIENMKAGDKVWSYNEKIRKEELNTVLDAFLSGYTDKIVEIKAGGELIEATEEHPFYVNNKWVKAIDLKQGTILTTKDGMKIKVDRVKVVKKRIKVPVYNFTVDKVHSFYVSKAKVLVHNFSRL